MNLPKRTGLSLLSSWHDLWGFSDLAERTASDKVLCNKAFNIAKNPNYDEYQRSLVQ